MGAGGAGGGESPMDEEREVFTTISEDILINIFAKLDDDPRYLASLACVCTRFSSIIRKICWKRKCLRVIPGVVADLLRSGRPADKLEEPPGGWASLQKLAVCCPGLWHAGVLLESWDFGLERDIGPSEDYKIECRQVHASGEGTSETQVASSCPWTLFDDLDFDADYQAVLGFVDNSNEVRGLGNGEEIPIGESGHEVRVQASGFQQYPQPVNAAVGSEENCNPNNPSESQILGCGNPEGVRCKGGEVEMKRKESPSTDEGCDEDSKRRKKESHLIKPHLATGVWNLSREQGNKLLQSRFRGDSLYICDWPGCIHSEEKRNYRLFRGVFKNFMKSHVWRNIKDMKAKKTVLNCCFCSSKGTWDMLTTFCLRRSFEYHDDGEPVVRAYVCENGHVAGAWTDRPMYN